MINKAKKAGIIYVKDVVHNNGDLFTLDEIHHRYGHCITLMQYNSLKSSIPKKWKDCLRENGNETKKSKIESISKMPHVCKHIYSYLIDLKSKEPVKAKHNPISIMPACKRADQRGDIPKGEYQIYSRWKCQMANQCKKHVKYRRTYVNFSIPTKIHVCIYLSTLYAGTILGGMKFGPLGLKSKVHNKSTWLCV